VFNRICDGLRYSRFWAGRMLEVVRHLVHEDWWRNRMWRGASLPFHCEKAGRGWLIAERAVRPTSVAVEPPGFDDALRFGGRRKAGSLRHSLLRQLLNASMKAFCRSFPEMMSCQPTLISARTVWASALSFADAIGQ